MKRDEIYAVWADHRFAWAPWVKPVLFSFMASDAPADPLPASSIDVRWIPRARPDVALVVDLPGAEGVVVGMELARLGFRPVPLYNALPYPPGAGWAPRAAVNVSSIVNHLRSATELLPQLRVSNNAPPAFLLDANRRDTRFALEAGDFDNRSICFTTDFPSVARLRESGVERAIVIERGSRPGADLARVLAEWTTGGIAVLRKDLERPDAPAPLRLPRTGRWHGAWYALARRLGLQVVQIGGFGAVIDPHGG